MHIVFKTTNGTKLIPVWQLVGGARLFKFAPSFKILISFLVPKKNAAKINNATKRHINEPTWLSQFDLSLLSLCRER